MHKPRVMVDFDGVLHSYISEWMADDVISDPPVPGAIEWLNNLIDSNKFDINIFTTRGKSVEGRFAVRKWLKDNGVKTPINVTSEKLSARMYIDDKGWGFKGNNFPTIEQIDGFKTWNK